MILLSFIQQIWCFVVAQVVVDLSNKSPESDTGGNAEYQKDEGPKLLPPYQLLS